MATRKRTGTAETTSVTVRVPVDLAEAFGRAAEREDRTISAELRRLMRLRVEEVCPQREAAVA